MKIISFLIVAPLNFVNQYCFTQWGALRLWAEIILIEPDPDNAGAGMANEDYPPHWLIF
jgi:hypothetical protein